MTSGQTGRHPGDSAHLPPRPLAALAAVVGVEVEVEGSSGDQRCTTRSRHRLSRCSTIEHVRLAPSRPAEMQPAEVPAAQVEVDTPAARSASTPTDRRVLERARERGLERVLEPGVGSCVETAEVKEERARSAASQAEEEVDAEASYAGGPSS